MKIDYSDLDMLADKLGRLGGSSARGEVAEKSLNEISNRLLRDAKKNTPVGVYRNKRGGTLKRGWAYNGVSAKGSVYTATVVNPTHYAGFVENGHRTRGGKGWVNGKFMLKKAKEDTLPRAEDIIRKNMLKKINEIL